MLIVRDDHHGALEVLQAAGEGINRQQIQMGSWFICQFTNNIVTGSATQKYLRCTKIAYCVLVLLEDVLS